MPPEPLSGAALREWREAWGMRGAELAPLLYYSRFAVAMIEPRPEVPAFVAAYVRHHPPPPEDPTYPPTPEGLAAVMAARGMGYVRFARWWGETGEMAVWHWLHGHSAVPLAVRAWLRAGAPPTGRIPFPPKAGQTPAPPPRPARPPVPRRPRGRPPERAPATDWVWLSKPRGWVPPAGLCAPGESYGVLEHCGVCAWRRDCRDLSARAS